jgi:hypothetical protein
VRHDRGADDADREVEQLRVGEDALVGQQAARKRRALRRCHQQHDAEAGGNHRNQADHHGLQPAQALILQVEDEDRIGACEQHARDQRQAEQQVQRDRDADELGEIAGDDAQLGEQPQRERYRPRVLLPAAGREVAAAADAQARGEDLQGHRHQAREQHDRQQ